MQTQFTAAAIRGYLNHNNISRSGGPGALAIEVVAETGSTNADLLARIASGEPLSGPTLLIAERQTAGRGRTGRVWHSAAGASLTFSLAWKFYRPLQELVGLPLAVGVALAEALGSQAVRVQLKWPNDILRDGRKLGGVLIATAADAEPGAYWCVIGIGINLTVPDQLETEIGHPVADAPWLAQQDRNQLMAVMLDHLVPMLHTFAHDGMVAFVTRWNKYHAYQDQVVQIMDQGQILHQGRALGIDDMGRLLIHTKQGRIAVLAGDVSLRKGGEGMKDVFTD